MSDRMTSCRAPGVAGLANYGLLSHAEMVAQYRRYYERQKAEAEKALAVPDCDLIVETFYGPWAQRNKRVVAPSEATL